MPDSSIRIYETILRLTRSVRAAFEQRVQQTRGLTYARARLLAVMDKRLADREFLAGADYSIADMAAFPWAKLGAPLLGDTPMPNLQRWVTAIAERPATVRAYAVGDGPAFKVPEPTEAQKQMLFQQGAATVRR